MKKFSQLNESISYGRYNEDEIKNHLKNSLPGYIIHEFHWSMDQVDSSGDIYNYWNEDNLKFDGNKYYLDVSDYSGPVPDMEVTYFQFSFSLRIEDMNQYEKYDAFNTTTEIYYSCDDWRGFPLQHFKKKINDLDQAFLPYSDIFDVLIDCGDVYSNKEKNTNPEFNMINIRMVTKDPIIGNEILKFISLQ